MVFSSAVFLFVFLPVVLGLYTLAPTKTKNLILLIASLFFYTWGAPTFVPIAILSVIIDFFIIKKMSNLTGKRRQCWLTLSLILNIGLLAYFKYANFFIDNLFYLYECLGITPFEWQKVLLPIGISFFTFQKISYSIDVYRKSVSQVNRFIDYALYLFMFQQLIAGPIIRFKEIQTQLVDRRASTSSDYFITGFFRFIVGLSKKVLIANILATQVDQIFALSPDCFSSSTAWLGLLAYTFQIYFDFAGYSDMAIGLGMMFGFVFPENFNFPYISQSISEFWRRWHITLGNWMKDYLYIPLGGNRVKVWRMYLNLIIVFLLSGLWHGDAWTFVFWGAFHGLFLIADKVFLLKFLKKIGKIPAMILTFFVAMIGWLFFRSDSLAYAFAYLNKMFSFDSRYDEFHFNSQFVIILILAVIFSFMGSFKKIENFQYTLFNPKKSFNKLLIITLLAIIFYILCGGAILSGSFNPFIYFRF